MGSNRLRLQDVADFVGVAKSTVSMALKGHPQIPAHTAERIRAAARKLGYRPDPILSAMGRNRWRTAADEKGGRVLAYVHALPRTRALRTVERYEGARREAERLGYALEGFRFADVRASASRLAAVLKARGIRGVLFDSLLRPEEFTDFPWQDTASAWCGTHSEAVVTHTIELDAFRRFEEAWERVWSAGARRIGVCVARNLSDERWAVSEAAYLGCRSRDGAEELPVLDLRGKDETAQVTAMKSWMRAKPDVVISLENTGWVLLRKAGFRMPQDVGFVALHLWPADSTNSGFSSMLEEQGVAAVRLVHHDLLNFQLGLPVNPLVVTIEARWREGDTLRPMAAAH